MHPQPPANLRKLWTTSSNVDDGEGILVSSLLNCLVFDDDYGFASKTMKNGPKNTTHVSIPQFLRSPYDHYRVFVDRVSCYK